jgi:polyphosphate kinase 2 (PPK2 family)
VAQEALLESNVEHALWRLIASDDRENRNLQAARILLTELRQRLDQERPPAVDSPQAKRVAPELSLDDLRSTGKLKKDAYKSDLIELQAELFDLTRRAGEQGLTSVLLFEGQDASGKGGAIRRMTRAMNASRYRVIPIGAPTPEELTHHYLWRFWRHLPRAGRVLVFDRSWYGRVLVERVEGFAEEAEWRRAYAEIVDFEEQLLEHDILLLKFWLHIDPDEQLRRFEAREETPYKKYKMGAEDYRNRSKWPAYREAAEEAFQRTSTEHAPWRLIPAGDKRFARLEVLRSFCDALRSKLE